MTHKTRFSTTSYLALCAAALLSVSCTELDFSGHPSDPANKDNTPTMHMVTFSANGATSGTAPAAKSATSGSTITLPDVGNMAKSGHTFGGWNTTAAGNGDHYNASATYTVTANATLYARWTTTNIAVTEVTLNKTSVSLTVGGGTTETLTATVFPSNASNKTISWKSSNTNVAIVSSDGVVTAVSAGNATITVTTTDGGKTATCAVTVTAATTLTYPVMVTSVGTGKSGDGNYAAGVSVEINAGSAPFGQQFKNWTTTSTGVTFVNASNSPTTFVMPANEVTVTAEFEAVIPCAGFTEGTTRRHYGKEKPQFCDERDGKKYVYVIIDEKKWMAENLNYAVPKTVGSDSSSYCHGNNPNNCAIYGRLYNWNTAMAGSPSSSKNPSGIQGVCPTGWHLPSDAEWTTFMSFVGDASAAGSKLKSQTDWNTHSDVSSTDYYGFSALPGGRRTISGGFSNVGMYGYWWSATEANNGLAWNRYMIYTNNLVYRNNTEQHYGFSVRCVEDY